MLSTHTLSDNTGHYQSRPKKAWQCRPTITYSPACTIHTHATCDVMNLGISELWTGQGSSRKLCTSLLTCCTLHHFAPAVCMHTTIQVSYTIALMSKGIWESVEGCPRLYHFRSHLMSSHFHISSYFIIFPCSHPGVLLMAGPCVDPCALAAPASLGPGGPAPSCADVGELCFKRWQIHPRILRGSKTCVRRLHVLGMTCWDILLRPGSHVCKHRKTERSCGMTWGTIAMLHCSWVKLNHGWSCGRLHCMSPNCHWRVCRKLPCAGVPTAENQL